MTKKPTDWKHHASAMLSGVLQCFVGHGKQIDKRQAPVILECDARAFDNWFQGRNEPAFYVFMNMCERFGPNFVNAWLCHLGMTGAKYIDPEDQNDVRVHTCLSMLDANFTMARADEKIDHRERAKLAPMCVDVANELLSFAAKTKH